MQVVEIATGAQLTERPSSAALRVATGSKGTFLPGIQSSPTMARNSAHVRASMGLASGFVLGSSV